MKYLLPLLAVLGAAPLAAQGSCVAAPGSPEAQTMGTKSVAIAFTPTRGPGHTTAGRVELGLGILTVPEVDQDALAPTTCGSGESLSNTNQLVVAAQPSIRVGLGKGFAAVAGWIPPIPVSGVSANIIGLGADWSSQPMGGVLIANLSVNASFGSVHGAFTCDEQDVLNPANSCYQGTPSDDSFNPAVYGADLTLGAFLNKGTVRPYVGGGYTRLMPTFQVNFTNRDGILDDNRVEATLNAAAIFGGLTWELARRWSVTGQFYTLVTYGSSVSLTVRAALGKLGN
jgi:hypothetical protein